MITACSSASSTPASTASHPDLAPNFNAQLSRNFTTDIPLIDGACATSLTSPAATRPTSTRAATAPTSPARWPPRSTASGWPAWRPASQLVNLRAGQDSGFFFLRPTIDALTFAGRHGIDVVNMSFFTDPWLYNCADNPADRPEEQAGAADDHRGHAAGASNFARDHGVTLVAALGNEHTDLGNPTIDDRPARTSRPGTEKTRTVNNTLPRRADRDPTASSRSAPSARAGAKADYSNYGTEQTDFAAPGGYFRDLFGTPQFRTIENLVLSP